MLCLITDRKLCPEPLPVRVEKLLTTGISYVMVREKDLPAKEFLALSQELAAISARFGARLIINSDAEAARAVGAWALHLPFDIFAGGACQRPRDMKLGVSVHSLTQALAAEQAGADYVLAGHIFETDCKKGLPGRGLDFLVELRRGLHIPIWAVGGIRPDNLGRVMAAGARVACIRSLAMKSTELSLSW